MKMMLRLCLFLMIVYHVQSKEYLTCVRNNETFSHTSVQGTNGRGERGYPGKKGARGAKGDVGNKGSKGEPGEESVEAKEQLRELEDIVANHTRMILALQRPVLPLCSDHFQGWLQLPAGHFYKLTATSQNWQQSREKCQKMGGDLAVGGIKYELIRRALYSTLLSSATYKLAWIGMSDLEQEGAWEWVDGSSVDATSAQWHGNQPDGGIRENCGIFRRHDDTVADVGCAGNHIALCEILSVNACV